MSKLKRKNLQRNNKSGAFELPTFMQSIPNNQTSEITISQLKNADSEWNFYKPLGDDKMQELMASIEKNGLIHPIVVQKKENGYLILSGHNRVRAYKNLFQKTKEDKYLSILAQIRQNLSDDEAREIIIDSNWVQRTLTPSERTKSIYQKYILLGRKKRTSNSDEQVRTYDIIAKDYEMSGKQIQRYIKLNSLINELLELLDQGIITLRAGLKLAQFDNETQFFIYSVIIQNMDDIQNKYIEKLNLDMSQQEIKSTLLNQNIKDIEVSLILPEHLKDQFLKMANKWISENK